MERRVCAAQLHEELMLQVQGRLLKERCWLVVDSHSPDVRWEWAEKNLSNRTQQDSKDRKPRITQNTADLQDQKVLGHTAGRERQPTASSQASQARNYLPGHDCSSQNTWRADGYPRPAYLICQFSARSSRIALVTHRFRWDRRPKNFSYLQRCLGGSAGGHGMSVVPTPFSI